MNENLVVVVVSVAVSGIVSVAVAIITYFITEKGKIAYSEQAKIISDLTKKKYEGIEEIRLVIKELAGYEDLSVTEPKGIIIKEWKEKHIIIPAIFYSYETLQEFDNKLHKCIAQYGHCVEPRVMVFLIVLRNTLSEYFWVCMRMGVENELLKWLGIGLYPEVRGWEKYIEKCLIRSMNNANSKYYARSGVIYDYYWKKYTKFFDESKISKLLCDEKSLLHIVMDNRDEIWKFINQAEEQGINSEEAIKRYFQEVLGF